MKCYGCSKECEKTEDFCEIGLRKLEETEGRESINNPDEEIR